MTALPAQGVEEVTSLSDRDASSSNRPVVPPGAVAKESRVSGHGLHSAMVRKSGSFVIEARDAAGNLLNQGGDPFVVSIRGVAVVHPKLHDKEDGTYLCEYRASLSGTYWVYVSLHGVSVHGSPFQLDCLRPEPDSSQCVLRGAGLHKAVAREPTSFEIEVRPSPHNSRAHALP